MILLTHNLHDAEDCIQDAFIRYLEYERKDDSNLEGFIFTIAKNIAIDKFRKKSKRRVHMKEQMPVNGIWDGEFREINFEARIEESIDAKRILSTIEKNSLLYKISSGYSYKDLDTDVKPATLRTRVFHERKKINDENPNFFITSP